MAKQKQQVEEQQEAEKLNRRECANRVVAEIDGDCTLSELAAKADALYLAGHDAEPDTDTAGWYVNKVLETLEGLGLVELEWELAIHPKVAKLGLPETASK